MTTTDKLEAVMAFSADFADVPDADSMQDCLEQLYAHLERVASQSYTFDPADVRLEVWPVDSILTGSARIAMSVLAVRAE